MRTSFRSRSTAYVTPARCSSGNRKKPLFLNASAGSRPETKTAEHKTLAYPARPSVIGVPSGANTRCGPGACCPKAVTDSAARTTANNLFMVIFEQAIILLSGGFTVWKCKKRVSAKLSSGRFMTQNDTPEIALRIRIKSLPIPGEFDEFDLRPYRIGGTYELPLRLALLFLPGG